MDHKLIESAELKIDNDGAGSISGYASTWEPFDRTNEKPAPGAFTPYLADFLRNGFIAVGHNWGTLPIATPTAAKEDDHGLWFSADFHSTTAAQEARIVASERMARGKSVATSIGYKVLDDEMVDAPELPGGRGRLLKAVPLYEISLVTVPANNRALLMSAKELLEAGGSFDAHAQTVEATVRAFTERAVARYDARAKEGRVLSGANRERLGNLKTSLSDVLAIIESLLADSEPKGALDLDEQLNTEYMRFLLMEAIANGVEIQ
jgi:HK97 family phage prohead protease